MGQNPIHLVNIKIAGKWMFIPLKMVLIGIDPYPVYGFLERSLEPFDHQASFIKYIPLCPKILMFKIPT
jgi:hypothetical protein